VEKHGAEVGSRFEIVKVNALFFGMLHLPGKNFPGYSKAWS
jgi:hypothetical protein